MRCTVRIPMPMRRLTEGRAAIKAQGSTISEVLSDLRGAYPELGARLFSPTGQLRHQINIFLNSEDIRRLPRFDAPLKEGDIITVLPAPPRSG